MPNMSLVKNPMPEQAPDIRNKNFDEVALGYTPEMAIEEAKRCLNCKKPMCVAGCPVNVKIPEFIALVAEGKFEEAYLKIKETSSLPAVCGRVCPQERQCESKCVRGIKGEPVAIGRLERFCADYHMKHGTQTEEKIEKNGHKVAVVGAGPAGLTCAGDLARLGYDVTVFEAFHVAGGVLMYGIPEFRLPKEIVSKEVEGLKKLGVIIETNTVVGQAISIDELMDDEGFEAVFIGTGAGLPSFMNIPGEGLIGVYSANEFLTRINLMKAYRDDYATPIKRHSSVAVIGGGNVSIRGKESADTFGTAGDGSNFADAVSASKAGVTSGKSKLEGLEQVNELSLTAEEKKSFLHELKKFITQKKRALYLSFSPIPKRYSVMKTEMFAL